MEAYAEDAVAYAQDAFGKVLDYSPESVETLEAIAAQLHKSFPKSFLGRIFKPRPSEAQLDGMSKLLGGYLGEVIRKQKEGNWGINGELQALGLQLGETYWIFPPAKAYKRLINGAEDNLVSFYRVMMSSKASEGIFTDDEA